METTAPRATCDCVRTAVSEGEVHENVADGMLGHVLDGGSELEAVASKAGLVTRLKAVIDVSTFRPNGDLNAPVSQKVCSSAGELSSQV